MLLIDRHRRNSFWRACLLGIVLVGLIQWYRSYSASTPVVRFPHSPAGTLVHNSDPVLHHSPVLQNGKIATGRVVVTGGGGNLGKNIVQRLLAASIPVTVLDLIFHPDELDAQYRSSLLLKVHIGDIRNTTALDSVFTPDVVGVIHLAAVSRVLWCLENEPDCTDVNERGTQLVLDAISQLNVQDHGKRWFLLASSREVYGDAPDQKPIAEDAEKKPANVYGASKLAAEQTVYQSLRSLNDQRSPGTLFAVALRLSNVYGGAFDHLERLVPSIATQALSHQLIQISGGEQHFDLLHIDDCVDAFLLAVRHLTKSLSSWSVRTPRTSFKAFNVASGDSVPVRELVSTLIGLTGSKSPVQYIPGDSRFPNVYRGNTEKAERVLGYRAAINIKQGLLQLVQAYLRRTEQFLSTTMNETCGVASPSLAANTQIEKLNNCAVHIEVDVQGEFVNIKAPGQEEDALWLASDDFSPMTLRTFIDPSPDGNGHRIWIRPDDPRQISLGVDSPRAGPVVLSQQAREKASAVTAWDIEVNAEESAVRLVVPGTDLHLVGPTYIGGNFSLASKKTTDVWPFRITPMCCTAPAPLPFLRDDPAEFSIEYQRTSTASPFRASPAKALCNRMERARGKIARDRAMLSIDVPQDPRGNLSSRPTDWVNANLPPCSNLCDHPTVCVDTGDCQCVLSSCPRHERFPFSSSANLPVLSFPPLPATETSLVEMVQRSSWRNVLRPQASRLVGANMPFPKIHAAPLSPDLQHWYDQWKDDGGHRIPDLRPQHCMSADSSMEKAVAAMHVPAEEAEMVFIPYYQGRSSMDFIDQAYAYSQENITGFDASKVAIPFTHDWGQCMHFEWNVWKLRENQKVKASPFMRSTTAWSVMGDLNSPCYRPHQDIVIPPRTCLSPSLFKSFPRISEIRPARDRRVLATFSGTPWGTGDVYRRRLMCTRDGWHSDSPTRRLHDAGPVLTSIWWGTGEYDYMGLLNDTVFCPQAMGTTGWATRLVDSVYAGCIPVLIGHAAHHPFFDVLDWGKISVRVEPSELANLEDVLLARYSLLEIERMQANLMLVRNAFVYPLDDVEETRVKEMMLDERGPLFFALLSTRMRLLTKWPTDSIVDRP